MSIYRFLKVSQGNPDWQFSPEQYFGKEFKIIDSSMLKVNPGRSETAILRQNPNEQELLAKSLTISVEENGKLDLVVLNEMVEGSEQVFLYDVNVSEGAEISFGLFVKNGTFNKHIIQITQKHSSTVSMYGLVTNNIGGDCEIIVKSVINEPNAFNGQLFYATATERSQTVCQSKIVVGEDGDAAHATVEMSNLTTDQGSKCYSKPDVVVHADDVISGYSTSNSVITQEKIDYMQCRGIDQETAVAHFNNGFRNQVIRLISTDVLRDEINAIYQD